MKKIIVALVIIIVIILGYILIRGNIFSPFGPYLPPTPASVPTITVSSNENG